MNPELKRIAGIHADAEGLLAAVWLAHDKIADLVTVYDCCIFRSEVFAVIGEGLNARGRWIPIAWENKAEEIGKKLQERGCNLLHEPVKETPALAEVTSREIWERMRTGRFKVDKRLAEWLDEFDLFTKQEGKIPVDSSPLMAATRYAIGQLAYARRLQSPRKTTSYPKVAMI